MSNVDVNVLMIGKSGVGKSSLINYLCGREVEKTGSGKAITKKGIFEHETMLTKTCCLHVFDTWGLEPDKPLEWSELITEAIMSHEVDDIRKWFHFIVYCISAKSARIEDFEVQFIKNLLIEKKHIIVVLTHFDYVDKKDLNEMKSVLGKLGIKGENVVNVCNVEKKLIGGKGTKQFGKEELLDRIQKNFWEMLCDRIPEIVEKEAKNMIKGTTQELKNYVNKAVNVFNVNSERKSNLIKTHCSEAYFECFSKIEDYSKQTVGAAIEYYEKVCSIWVFHFYRKDFIFNYEIALKQGYPKEFFNKLAQTMTNMLNLISFVFYIFTAPVLVKLKKEEYNKKLDSIQEVLLKQCEKERETLRAQLLWENDSILIKW